jgi:hypothetical protein
MVSAVIVGGPVSHNGDPVGGPVLVLSYCQTPHPLQVATSRTRCGGRGPSVLAGKGTRGTVIPFAPFTG